MSHNTTTIAALDPEQKRALLRQLLEAKKRPRRHPLSYPQQRLWFLDQLAPGSTDYTILFAVRIADTEVSVSHQLLERSVNELVRQHEILRTTFQRAADGGAVQVIRPALAVEVPLADLGHLPEEDRDRGVREVAARLAAEPFDLAHGPLLRVELVRLSDHEWVAVLALHHIIADNHSIEVMLAQLQAIYQALATGEPPPSAPAGPSYGDFARWQRRRFASAALGEQRGYWRTRLADLPTADLPTDHSRPLRPSQAGDRVTVPLPKQLTRKLDDLRRRAGATQFMLMLAAFFVLLQRYTGHGDLVVGTPISGRYRRELENAIGVFLNNLVLRASLAGDPSFRELLARVRETCVGAFAHQEVPFEQLVEELEPQRDPSRHPLFQIMFLYLQELEMPLPGTFQPMAVTGQTSKFDLTHLVIEEPDQLLLIFEYKTDLFERGSIVRMAHHLARLLAAVAGDPDRPLSRLEMLGSAERHLLLIDHQDTRRWWPGEPMTIPALFERQAAATPDALAVACEDRCLTYGELARRVRHLASALRRRGVGPEVPVAVLMERSTELVTALLGVLEAGGCYLPLDPDHPRERLTFMLADSCPALVLAQERFEPLVSQLLASAGHRGGVLFLDRADASEEITDGDGPPDPGLAPDHLAYVIYTSGSTGQPKAAMNCHRALRSHLLWMQDAYPLTAADRVLQKTPFTFDVSVWEFFWPLITGAALVVARPGGHRDPSYLVDLIARQGVTTLHFVPSMLQTFLEANDLDRCSCLRRVIASGEALPASLVRRFTERLPAGPRLYNLYGPTEAAIDVTHHPCDPEADARAVPIGRPVANTAIRVLDRTLRHVGLGISGELHIGGVQLARGYRHRPALTAERFVPDAWSGRAGARLYKTGDLVRRRAGGNVDFVGRLDHQVKLRGFRIELGEIEHALAQQPGVRETVVLLRDDLAGGEPGLVAYLTATDNGSLDPEALRRSLGRQLPDHMLPAAFLVLESLPLNANGKVDRKRLPRPAGGGLGRAQYQPPRTAGEQLVAGVWGEVLGLDEVGVRDDFFRLGGHSLLATRVVARLAALFGVEPPLMMLFENPVLEGFAQRLDDHLRTGGDEDLAPPPLVALGRPEDGAAAELPLSFGQERLWFLDRLQPGDSVYNMPAAVRLLGEVDAAVLGRAFSAVVQRHEALRTVFVERPGGPVQRVLPPAPQSLPVVDLRRLAAERRRPIAEQLVTEASGRAFDLTRGPLLRTVLIRLADGDSMLLVILHHIIGDGWSLEILMREVQRCYRAFAAGEQPSLPGPAVQYGDFSAWQRSWLDGTVLAQQLDYWRGQLAGAPVRLELPTDRPRPAVQSFRGDAVAVAISQPLADRLQALCREQGTTLFMALLAVFQVLLARWARQTDVVVGTPIAGRGRLELEELVGFFVNTLALRTDLSGDPTFGDLLERVRGTTLGAYAHQDVPFEKLVEDLEPERNLGHAPIFQVMLILQNTADAGSGPDAALEGLELRPEPVRQGSAKFDLSLSLEEVPADAAAGRAGGLFGSLEYSTDLFERATAERLAAGFVELLTAAVERPDAPVFELPLAPPEEWRQLAAWGRGEACDPDAALFHRRVAAWAEQRPEHPALIFEGGDLSYRQLVTTARRWARRLRSLGVAPEVTVGLAFDRTPERIVALLAVLEAGGAFLPLDPAYPPDRLAYMIEDSGVELVLSHPDLAAELPEIAGVRRLCLEVDEAGTAEAGTPEPVAAVDPENLAYVIYTSGSTGRPKGTLLRHRGLVSLMQAQDRAFDLGPGERVLQFSSLGFDASVFEVVMALANGVTLVQARREALLPGPGLVELLERERVSRVVLPPSVLAALPERPLPKLAAILAAGEALPESLIDRWAPGRRFFNAYGPTEATVWSTLDRCLPGAGAPTIGRPVTGTELRVLDPALRPVPTGVPGELLIGGVVLARGYLGRPALTAERFVPHPGPDHPGERLYRTGDLVRWRGDGRLDFLGRIDHQVKLRGFRIEPGEIEALLESRADVERAVVLLRRDLPAGPGLVAYVAGGRPGVTAELRRELAERLPEHMVPSHFIELESMPLNPSGKVDRRALPAPIPELMRDAELVAPRTPLEELLAGAWSITLGLERVGVEDDFFALGGHSLLATRLTSRLAEALGFDVPVRLIFEAPTVARLARELERRRDEATRVPPLVPARGEATAASAELYPLSFAQQRLWFLDRLEPGSAAYNIPVAVRVHGGLRPEVLAHALGELVRRHSALRTTFQQRGGNPRQRVAPAPAAGWALPLAQLDLADLPAPAREAELRRRIEEDARRPFDLERGPLLRAFLVRLAASEHAVQLNMHHIVSDGWSMEVLMREMAALYEALTTGTASPLPAIEIRYADYAVWQRSWLDGEELERQVEHWRRQLAGAPARLELATDRPRPPVQTHHGASVPVAVPPALHGELRRLGQVDGATLFMTLLAAFDVLLARWARQDDVVVGSPVAGRQRAQLEGLVGFFVNTLPLRADLSGAPSFRDLLGRIRAATLDAYDHQDVPFEKLVEALEPDRDPSYPPLFQVMFALQQTAAGAPAEAGLGLELLSFEAGVAKFDLTLSLEEQPDGLYGRLEYNSDLFNPATAERMAAHYLVLLEGVVAEPDRPVTELRLSGEAERRQVLIEWNATSVSLSSQELVPAQVARAADREPLATAVMDAAGTALSYRRLLARARRLAHHLRALGVGPETRVGVLLGRSPELVVSYLAVFEAGGCYLALDPDLPAERLAFELEDAGAEVAITTSELSTRVPAGVVAVELDLAAAAIAGRPATPIAPSISPASLAYVIYTSGSTGRPKGVAVSHGALRHLVDWYRSTYAVGAADRTACLAGLGFDAVIFELWPYLACGASVHLAPEEVRSAPAALRDWLTARGITVTFVPTPLAEALLGLEWPRGGALRTMLTGGDRLRRRPTGEEGFSLVNNYGPTETTVVATCAPVAPASGAVRDRAPSIGLPIARLRTYVLDRGLRPAPVGIPGELYLAGDGVARGYLGRSALTAECFLPCPWGEAGERMYRTGDVVRWLPKGMLEFLGREDQQVKLRGFRIELGELEIAARSCPSLGREASTIAQVRRLPSGSDGLVLYVAGAASADAAALREYLGQCLPEYMVPSAVAFVETLPLNASGKIDRRALPAPRLEDMAVGSRKLRTATEDLLGGIFAQVLGIERVAAEDDFFALGGHSLLATQVISRVRDLFGVELPLRRIFDAPSVVSLAAAIDTLAEGPALPPIERFEGRPPLSFAQQRLWFLDRLEPGSPAYNVPSAVRLGGPLSAERLEAALARVIARHDSLRATFAASPTGEPVQRIAPQLAITLERRDLGDLDEEARAAEVGREIRRQASTPFDLARGPLLRARLLRLGDAEHVLLLTLHHIVSDGWSLGVLLRELVTFYQRPEAELPPLTAQYGDYAAWQRAWLRGQVLEAQLAYWRSRLEAAPPVLELPADHPRTVTRRPEGQVRSAHLPGDVIDRLRRSSRDHGTTMFMTLLAGFKALLARFGAGDDIVVGTPVAGRRQLAVEDLIGFFVNTLVLRTDLSGDPQFSDLLAREREVTLGAYGHQDVPFERLVEELAAERSLAHTPLFQVMFSFEDTSAGAPATGDLDLEPISVESGTAKFDLSLSVEADADGGATAALEYATDLFSAATAERLLEAYGRLLAAAAVAPETPLSRLPILGDAERSQLLDAWSGSSRQAAAIAPWLPIHKRIVAGAAQAPDSPALLAAADGRELTRRQLAVEVGAVARALRAQGVGTDVRVGLALERSPEAIVALLAVLEAGGAYVPLDPGLPAQRLRFMAGDAGVALVLASGASASRIAAELDTEVWTYEQLKTRAETVGAVAPPAEPSPETLAYVIYTSGSTGRPKGVAVSHGALARFVEEAGLVYRLNSDDRVLQFVNLGFDISVEEIFVTLAAGATLVLRDEAMLATSRTFFERCERLGLTMLNLPTAFWHQLIADSQPGEISLPSSLRQVVIGGEEAHREAVDRWRALAGDRVRLWNSYGPTEATVAVTWADLTAPAAIEDQGPRPAVAIGRGRPGARIYVLDAGMEPLPVAVVGQLYLGGDGLARGYLGRPGTTAGSFVPDPFSARSGARLYATGDRVRFRTDGELEFFGRTDDQVQIRGFRVEPEEVASRLRGHPGVGAAVVLPRDLGSERARLVAFVVPVAAPLAAADLRQHLARELPEYMLPASFVEIERLPVTARGKLDRGALLAIDETAPSASAAAPRNLLELRLMEIWETLLDRRGIGIRDDFFEAGGHSLLAVRLVAAIDERLGRELPVTALFRYPTIERLAELLREQTEIELDGPLQTIQPGESERPALYLVHAVGGSALPFLELARNLETGQPVHAFQARGDGETSLTGLAESYAEVLLEQRSGRPYWLGGWSMGGVVAYEMARQLQAAGLGPERLLLLDSYLASEAPLPPAADRLTDFLHDLARSSGLELAELDASAGLEGVLEQARRLGLLPAWIELDELRRRFGRFEAHLHALDGYHPDPLAGGRVDLFRPDNQDLRPEEEAIIARSDARWRQLAGPGLSIHRVAGDHYSMLQQPRVLALARRIASLIAESAPPTEAVLASIDRGR